MPLRLDDRRLRLILYAVGGNAAVVAFTRFGPGLLPGLLLGVFVVLPFTERCGVCGKLLWRHRRWGPALPALALVARSNWCPDVEPHPTRIREKEAQATGEHAGKNLRKDRS